MTPLIIEAVSDAHLVDRRPIIGVMGSHTAAHAERSRAIGAWIARCGFHLLTGGGEGVMGAVTEAFAAVPDRQGRALAVVPSVRDDPLVPPVPGYPNQWVEIPIYTHLDRGVAGDEPTSRNHINVLTSTVVVLLPGGTGTASEARLALRYRRPCIGYLHSRSEIPGLPTEVPVEASFEQVTSYIADHARRVEVS